MSKTKQHLMDAFAGESQANRKYLAYSKAADKEGLTQVARLFRAAAEAETIHALTHFKNAGNVKSSAENLQDALAGETFEFTSMYPGMIKDMEAEGETGIANYTKWVNQVEEVHANLYKKAIADPKGMENVDYYICSVCGYTHEGPTSDNCPICKASAKVFYKID